jgi:hypothetical protein
MGFGGITPVTSLQPLPFCCWVNNTDFLYNGKLGRPHRGFGRFRVKEIVSSEN